MAKGRQRRETILRLWYEELGPHCAYCDRRMTPVSKALKRRHGEPVPAPDPTIDHMQPKALGGSSKMKNLVVACFECNNKVKDDEPMFPSTDKLNRWFRAVDKYRVDQQQPPQPDPDYNRR